MVLPFCLLGYQAGRVAWFLLNVFVVLLSADALWRFYGGPRAIAGLRGSSPSAFSRPFLC